ncbi:hypothetical protein HDU85_006068 [Gaertneriomyces sp. JEL0708]|nr:hypothetical protein HDU85_006068 [Gaertneriomyces sp. JEL0708]
MGTDQEDGDIGFMPFEKAANKEPLVDRLPELAHMPTAPLITPSPTIPDKREQRWSTIFVPLIPSTSTCDPPGSVEGPKDPWDIVAELSSSAPTKAVPMGSVSTEDDLLAFFAGSTPASTSNTQRETSIWDLPAAAEPDAVLEENVDADKMVLIRHILDLQKTLRLKVSRAENAHAAYAKQHSENVMLREYISNLKAATRKMEQETPEDVKKPAKPKRRGLFGYVPS